MKAKVKIERIKKISSIVVLIVILFPLIWMIYSSFRGQSKLISQDIKNIIPVLDEFSISSYKYVLEKGMLTFFKNSIISACTVTLFSVVISCMTGYALTRLKFRGSRIIGRIILFTYMIPPILIVIPLFIVIVKLGLNNTLSGLILTHITFALPFSIWLMRGFFLSLPPAIEEAALIDGASLFGAFVKVVLPLSLPGISSIAIFSFILSWNEYLFASILLTSNRVKTLPIGIITTFTSDYMYSQDWVRLMSAAVLSSIPVLIIFIFLQRSIVSGLSAGAVKE